jgi:hypothetical protein
MPTEKGTQKSRPVLLIPVQIRWRWTAGGQWLFSNERVSESDFLKEIGELVRNGSGYVFLVAPVDLYESRRNLSQGRHLFDGFDDRRKNIFPFLSGFR